MKCRFANEYGHNVEAVAKFSLPGGCLCYPDDREQYLCEHHARKATPLGGMVLLEDYSKDFAFTQWWVG